MPSIRLKCIAISPHTYIEWEPKSHTVGYIEPYLNKIKQTGKKLHERTIYNELPCKYVARYRKAKVKK